MKYFPIYKMLLDNCAALNARIVFTMFVTFYIIHYTIDTSGK